MDPRRRKELMFESNSENSFERTEVYFTVIEVLRNASEWIKDNTKEVERLSGKWDFFSPPQASGQGPHGEPRRWECYRVIKNNWKLILKKAKDHERELLETTRRKMEEVKSLRDGVRFTPD